MPAREFHSQLQDPQLNWPQARAYFTVGPGTAEALSPLSTTNPSVGLQVNTTPKLYLNSQSSNSLKAKKWLLITGENGRDLLPEALRSRGAEVKICACYRRLPTTDEVTTAEQELAPACDCDYGFQCRASQTILSSIEHSGSGMGAQLPLDCANGADCGGGGGEQISEFKVAAAQIHEARSALTFSPCKNPIDAAIY